MVKHCELQDFRPPSAQKLTVNEENQKEKNCDRNGETMISDLVAGVHIMKSSLGTGLLAMPYAFNNSGILLGVVGSVLVSILCTHCVYIMVKCSQELCFLQGKSSMTYTETVEAAFRIGGKGRFNKWSGIMRRITNIFLFITYYGLNIVYVVFIESSFEQVLVHSFDWYMNIEWYALGILVLLLGTVRHMKPLAIFSATAIIFLVVGCSFTLYYCFIDMPSISSRPLIVDFTKWPIFVSTVIFSMEGIGSIIPVENSMRHPSHFLGFSGVLILSMAMVSSIFLTVGFFGYVKYGSTVQGSIILNLPQDKICQAVKLLVALAILFSYPLQLTASMEVVWQVASKLFPENQQYCGYYLTRSLMIIGTVVIAVAVPHLSAMISLIGAVGFSGLGLLLPIVVEVVTFWDVIKRPFGFIIFKDIIVIIIWAIVTTSGAVASINQIVMEYTNDE